jgi:predicted amidohydrolase YtcJ
MGNSTARFYEPQLHSGERATGATPPTPRAAPARDGAAGEHGAAPPGRRRGRALAADPRHRRRGDRHAAHADGAHDARERPARAPLPHHPHAGDPRAPRSPAHGRSGIIAEVQPYHAIDDMRWMEERIGERSRWAYAFRTLHDAGVMLSFGSDWPGTNASWYTADPLLGIYAAVTRQTLDGEPEGGWFPEERVDVETALRAYTVNNAYAAGEERAQGRYVGSGTEVIDLAGRLAIPGFIEGHGHFMGLGQAKMMLDLTTPRNWDEIVAMVARPPQRAAGRRGSWAAAGTRRSGTGAGADGRGEPRHTSLSAVSPDNPVYLTHASGHAPSPTRRRWSSPGSRAPRPTPRAARSSRRAGRTRRGCCARRRRGWSGAALAAVRGAARPREEILAGQRRMVELAGRRRSPRGSPPSTTPAPRSRRSTSSAAGRRGRAPGPPLRDGARGETPR